MPAVRKSQEQAVLPRTSSGLEKEGLDTCVPLQVSDCIMQMIAFKAVVWLLKETRQQHSHQLLNHLVVNELLSALMQDGVQKGHLVKKICAHEGYESPKIL